MSVAIDIESLAAPLAEDAHSGGDLEYDPGFLELERLATPREERAVGDSVIPAEEPEWDKVESQAVELLGRSRDLRIAVHLCAARVRRSGPAGWCEGLALVRALLENLWDSVHPQLDAEDDDDPTARVNAVMPLADPLAALGYFRLAPFVQSPRLGRFSLRDLRVANGTLKVAAEGDPPPTLGDIEACCLDCPEEQLESAANEVRQALEHARAIDTLFSDRLGAAGPELGPLVTDLYELDKFLYPQWAARSGAAVEPGDDDAGPAPTDAARAAGGPVSGHADVLTRIDEICAWYARQEPSSPVPVLLRRAQRLVGKSFEDVLQDIAPGGMSEFSQIAGPQPE